MRVTGSTGRTETSNWTVGSIVDLEVIDGVPLMTRNVFPLVQFSAAVAPANGTHNASATSGFVGRAFSVPAGIVARKFA